jgi:hypothetical protein
MLKTKQNKNGCEDKEQHLHMFSGTDLNQKIKCKKQKCAPYHDALMPTRSAQKINAKNKRNAPTEIWNENKTQE